METKPKEITPAELKQRWNVKKNQIETLANNVQSLRLNLTKDLKSEDEKLFLTALVISVMDKTAERVGNDESANNGHYGVTGMEKKHIKVNGDKIHFKYIGKSGVEHEKEFTDSKLADALKRAITNTSNHNVFTTSDGFSVNAAKVNRYLKDFNVRAKDLRGYAANKWVIEKLKSNTIEKEEKDRKKKFNEILKSVSEKIGHGKATLRKHYLIPELETNYIEMGKIIDVSKKDSYEKGGPVTTDGKKGGWLKGKRHYSEDGKPLGGIPAVVGSGEKPVELEGGEVIINREASKKHWKELSRINQSAGDGVPIGPPEADADEYKKGGNTIEFNPNHLPNRRIYDFAKMVKSKYPKVWDLGGNEFGNEAYVNLERAIKRGYWTDSEEWMYIKWRGYVARHKGDYQIAGVIAMLKWIDKVGKGWPYMKKLIEDEIKKRYSKDKMKTGGEVGVDEIPKNVLRAYDRWNDPKIMPNFLGSEKEILNAFAYKLKEDNKIKNITSGAHAYVEALKWLDENKSMMKTGGGVEDEGIDLFEDYENIPKKVQTILDRYAEEFGDDLGNMDYKDMAKMHDEVYAVGYTFESGLDNQPYDLRPIGTKGKSEVEELKKGGKLIKRADGSYSKRGLWDNIRDNAGSGKKATKEMLEQEEKIKREMKRGGELTKGIKAEQEHKGTLEKLYQRKITPSQAPKQIAEDHLKEDKNYYTKLSKAKLKTGGLAIANWFKSKPKVSDDVLYNWASQRLDINLLNWAGFHNKSEYEEQMDQPFVLENFIKDFRSDLEDTFIRRQKANMIEMGKRGGAMKDSWVTQEDNRMGFSVHGLSRSVNPNVMLHTLYDAVDSLEKGLNASEKMFAVDPKLGRVEIQGKDSRKLYYVITLNEDGTYNIKSSKNEPLQSMQFSNVSVNQGSIADNRGYIRAKLFGETEKYKEPEELNIGDIVLIDKVNENGYRGYVKVIEKDGYVYKGVSISHADNPARQDYQVKNATQKFSIGNVSDSPSIQDEENLKIYKTRIKNQ
jgi:hypothetical protein